VSGVCVSVCEWCVCECVCMCEWCVWCVCEYVCACVRVYTVMVIRYLGWPRGNASAITRQILGECTRVRMFAI